MKFPLFERLKRITPKNTGRNESKKRVDLSLVGLILLLCFIGIIMVYDSSVALALRDFGDRFYYVREQAKWVGAGVIIFFLISLFPYKVWYRAALPILLGTMVLLMAVFIPGLGVSALGAKRWINLGFTVIQPAEFAKLALVIYFSAWFSNPEKKRLNSFLLLTGMILGLIILEPDLGTAIIIGTISISLYFFSGAPTKHFLFMIPIVIAGIIVLAVASPYRMRRVTSFLDPAKDPLGSSYQVRQATIALGSGGLFGVGLGKSRQKYQYLPEANTDSIAAIIGEETGFVGMTALLVLYLVIIYKGFMIAKHADSPFGKLLALGISTWIGAQAGINIAANAALIPLTGVPLPFISYGGSSLIVLLSATGILATIAKASKYDK